MESVGGKKELVIAFSVDENTDEYLCPQCPRRFKTKGAMENHFRLHLNHKQHKCNICGKVYVQQANLKYHMIAAHENRRPFKCGVCHKTFSQPGNLQTHLSIHQTFRAYACSECKQSFTQLGNLKSHCKNKHSSVLYLSCGICLLSFGNAKELVHHIKGCRSMNTYCCELCNNVFCDPNDLNLHMQTMHKGHQEVVSKKRRKKYLLDEKASPTLVPPAPSVIPQLNTLIIPPHSHLVMSSNHSATLPPRP